MTILAFVDSLRDMTVTGVKKSYEYPPRSLTNAELPAMWPMFPGVDYARLFDCDNVNETMTIQLAIATEAIGNNTQPQKYADIMTLADALGTALKVNITAAVILSWSIEARAGQIDTPPLFVSGIPYWGVVATITGIGEA